MLKSVRVKDYMAVNLFTVTPDMDVLRAINLFVEKRISGAPVIDSTGELVGMLSEKDCLKVALQAAYHEHIGGKVKDYMSSEISTVREDMSIIELAEMFISSQFRRFPVLDDSGKLVGQISRHDVLRALDMRW